MNEIAKALWDKACDALNKADETEDVNLSICYTSIGEFALKLGRFAVEHPELVLGLDSVPVPPGVKLGDVQPAGPVGGPRVWGSPSS